MEELSDYSSAVIEFKPTALTEKHIKLADSSINTDALPPFKNTAMETNRKCQVETQTEVESANVGQVDDTKLAQWLRKIFPQIEVELLKGPTPLADSSGSNIISTPTDNVKIQTYQRIVMDTTENCQGLAIWLAVHTYNAPALVVTTAFSPHDNWCEHVNQNMKLFMPKRVKTGNFIVFTEVKSVSLKACLKSLCTNEHNKNIFAGSTLDGDICIWQYEHNSKSNQVEVMELHNITSPHGYAVAMDWSAENRLLTCHSNGWVVQWLIGKEFHKEWEYLIKPAQGIAAELTTVTCLGVSDFVVGTKDGAVYQCWHSTTAMNTLKQHIEVTPLRKHLFMVATLFRSQIAGQIVIISCDLSGQVYYHDIRHSDDDDNTTANVMVQIPLPFKNAISCSRDANIIYSPGADGSLDCYRIRDSVHTNIKGVLRGKGNFIKCSDNGCWIITGLYENDFQIFYVEH